MVDTDWSSKLDPGESGAQRAAAQSPSPTAHPVAAAKATDSSAASAATKKTVEISARTGKPKRRKALRACGNCQRTHLTCDDNRPCERCIKRGCADTCADGVRKKVKYLDKTASDSHLGLHSALPNSGLRTVYSPHLSSPYSSIESHRRSMPNLGADVPVAGYAEMSLPHTGVPPAHAAGHAEHAGSANGLIVSPVAAPLPQQHLTYLDEVGHHATHSPTAHGRAAPITPGGAPPHAAHHRLSDAALQDHHLHGLPASAAASPELHAPLGHGSGSGDAAYPGVTTALVGPAASADPNSFNSYAADSEYTVVARMLESSRAKADTGTYSPPDAAAFSSSNVDLRNFVTLQAPVQEPAVDEGYSWLEPSPPPPPAVVVQNRRSGMPRYRRSDSDGSDQSTTAVLPMPSDIYRNVREPYPYTPAFHALLTFLKQRFAREQLMRIVRSMARIRPAFIAVTKDLTHEDLVFMEQCFQRSLLEYEKYFAYSGTPSIVWRRTGQIAAVAPEFCMLTQWPRHELRSRFIVEVMSDESAIDYFERFSEITCTDTRGEIMYECYLLTPMGQQIRTSAVLTVRKDLFGIPMVIIGNFLPHV